METKNNNDFVNSTEPKKKNCKRFIWLGVCAVIVIATIFVFITKNDSGKAGDGLYCAKNDGKWGYVNNKGDFVIEPQFMECYIFAENGLARVRTEDGNYGYINKKGEFVIEPQPGVYYDFYDNGLAPFENGLWGYIDENGEIAIEPIYRNIGVFSSNGLAYATENGMYGYIDESGEWAIEQQFDDAEDFGYNDLAAVKFNGKWGYIDESGNLVIAFQHDDAKKFGSNGLAAVKDGELWGYIGEDGTWVIEPMFKDVGDFDENHIASACISKEDGDRWGFIDEKGEWVIEPEFMLGNSFPYTVNFNECGYIIAYSFAGESWVVIDSQGRIVTNNHQKDVEGVYLHQDILVYKKNDNYGLMELSGKTITDAKYDVLGYNLDFCDYKDCYARTYTFGKSYCEDHDK